MALSDRTTEAIVTTAAGVGVIVLVRAVLHRALFRYEQLAEARREPDELARLRTRLAVLQRAVVALLVLILAWQVLTIFPETKSLANTVLASGAVLALFVGLALTAPLGNLGAGILLALAQPARLGDRITVEGATGEVEQLTLIYTVLVTDDDRRVYIPNSRMVSSVVVNRTIKDPRRTISVSLPVALEAPIERARAAVHEAAAGLPAETEELTVRLDAVGEKTAWLSVTAFAPRGTDVAAVTGELRERGLAALARAGLLPA